MVISGTVFRPRAQKKIAGAARGRERSCRGPIMAHSRPSPGHDQAEVFDALLARYVVAGPDGISRVRYRTWRDSSDDMAALRAYVRALESQTPSEMSAPEAIAFWSNLYNAVTLEVVLENYPVQSIRDIRASGSDAEGKVGPWTMDRVTVEGRRLSLNAIEHDILRRQFADPRIHYAINCASASCPNLPPRAWRADSLDLALDDAARSYINHERGIRILPSGQIEASSIFKWYAGDFGDREASILAHQAQYAQGPLADALTRAGTIAAYDYDWSLNDAEG